MLLNELVTKLNVINIDGNIDVPIAGIAYDSRKIRTGYLFVAVEGFITDGHEYINQAIANGARGIIVQKPITLPGVPVVQVQDSRVALAIVASEFYQHPSRQLTITGVTGTNGKTTTTHLVAAVYKYAGNRVGLVGTIQNLIGGKEIPAAHTTPESLDLQQLFAGMLKAGVTHAAMEVSSHALALERVTEVDFDAAIFTNLSQDHLDFHRDMDEYARAKSKLFALSPLSIINVDDNRAQEMIKASGGTVITYGLEKTADVGAKDIKISARGVSFVTTGRYGEHLLDLKLSGEFNIYNALAAFTLGAAQGYAPDMVAAALGEVPGVAGRFELVDHGQPFAVVVDYAHTPDGLENILKAARQVTENRLITVFGCGGDRDRTKRPIMGEIAFNYSDIAVVTSDNPRTEDPGKIIDDILVGVRRADGNKQYKVIQERQDAIIYAVNEAQPGDVVVIAGKGHETYQIIGNTKYDFDDRVVAAQALTSRGYEG